MTIILNEKAGSVAEDARRTVEVACARAGLQAEIVTVPGSGIAAAATRAAKNGSALVAAGGDGTVATVAGVAVRAGTAFGVIPLGTLNHFAKDAGIPLEIDAAIAAIAGGRTVPLDTGEINGRTFVNNASVGFYARVVRERQLEQRDGRGKWTSLAVGLVRAWTQYRQVTVRMTVDGTAVVRRTPFIFVGNGEYIDQGPRLGRRTSLTTGRLWVALAPECTRAEMLSLVLRAIAGRLTPDVNLETFEAAGISIDAGARGAGVAADGELLTANPPLRCACRAGSLRTLLPA